MRKEDFKNAIDSVEPDTYLKTRLKSNIKSSDISSNKKPLWIGITATALAAILVLSAGIFNGISETPQIPVEPSETTQQSTNSLLNGFILIASATENQKEALEPESLEFNESYPYKYYLSVEDVRGKSEAERKAVFDKIKSENLKICSENDVAESCVSVCGCGDNTIINHLMMNSFKLDIKNAEDMESICITNESDYGYMEYDKNANGVMVFDGTTYSTWEKGKKLTISAEEYLKNDGEMRIHWRHSAEMDEAIDKNPDMPLSTFKDTVTFTVNYKDGTSAIGTVDIAFGNDGNMTATCKGYQYY